MNIRRYILNDNLEPVPCPDLLTWAAWMEKDGVRRIAIEEYPNDHSISTVFLGLDYNFQIGAVPVLFETMVFATGHPMDQDCRRYCTVAEALVGHAEMCDAYVATMKEAQK